MSVREALLARLRSVVEPVYDGEVEVDDAGQPLSQRYAVLFVSPGFRGADDLNRAVAGRYVFRWQVTSVGLSSAQAEWVAARCRDALLDARLAAEGWELGSVEHRSSADIRRDEDIPGPPLFYAVDTYELPATR